MMQNMNENADLSNNNTPCTTQKRMDVFEKVVDDVLKNDEKVATFFITLCDMHKQTISNGGSVDENVVPVLFNRLADAGFSFMTKNNVGRIAFHALCALFSEKKLPETYREKLRPVIQRAMDLGVDLNEVDANSMTAFAFANMEMKGNFVRHQKSLEDKRLLDMFLILKQVLEDKVDKKEALPLIHEHIQKLQKEVYRNQVRSKFYE